ncbi:hypothetical protein B0H17DRAFT_1135189 [Mycena rosella]|uniref:Uncharacterized protein n=1 Tax=Mycena rosella TaxID=1033263 RepID=A0AAD7DE29_MYCRO|nr:hypothetical protein B0H17DRAFT_1135189 [Mycena rosella]
MWIGGDSEDVAVPWNEIEYSALDNPCIEHTSPEFIANQNAIAAIRRTLRFRGMKSNTVHQTIHVRRSVDCISRNTEFKIKVSQACKNTSPSWVAFQNHDWRDAERQRGRSFGGRRDWNVFCHAVTRSDLSVYDHHLPPPASQITVLDSYPMATLPPLLPPLEHLMMETLAGDGSALDVIESGPYGRQFVSGMQKGERYDRIDFLFSFAAHTKVCTTYLYGPRSSVDDDESNYDDLPALISPDLNSDNPPQSLGHRRRPNNYSRRRRHCRCQSARDHPRIDQLKVCFRSHTPLLTNILLSFSRNILSQRYKVNTLKPASRMDPGKWDRFNAGVGPMMRMPGAQEKKIQRQAKIDRLQRLREAPKASPKIPRPGLPFPSTPPNVASAVASSPVPSPVVSNTRPTIPPATDCRRCKQELFPRSVCICGTPTERESRRKSADDSWFNADPKGWFDYNAPPPRLLPTPAQLDAELEAVLEWSPEKERMQQKRAAKLARQQAAAWKEQADQAEARERFALVAEEAAAKVASLCGARTGWKGGYLKHIRVFYLYFGHLSSVKFMDNPPIPTNTMASEEHIVNSVSLYLKRESLSQGKMSTAFKIWLDIDEKKIAAARPANYVKGGFERRMRAAIAQRQEERRIRTARHDTLMRHRMSTNALRESPGGRSRLRLLHARKTRIAADVPATLTDGHNDEASEEARVRAVRLEHLLRLRGTARKGA